MTERATRLGFLYPGFAAEDDYPWLTDRLEPAAEAVVVHTSVGEDAHRADALRDLGSADRLLAGAEVLGKHGPDAVIWACTSGSFVFGWDGAREQVDLLSRRLAVPCSSTSFSLVAATRALGVSRVAVAATYPANVTELFVEFLAAADIETVNLRSKDIMTAVEVGTLGREAVLDIASASDRPDAEAVLLPDTALHSVRWLDEVEAAVGKPVVTANQATIWHAWQLSAKARPQAGLGTLFREVAEPDELILVG